MTKQYKETRAATGDNEPAEERGHPSYWDHTDMDLGKPAQDSVMGDRGGAYVTRTEVPAPPALPTIAGTIHCQLQNQQRMMEVDKYRQYRKKNNFAFKQLK